MVSAHIQLGKGVWEGKTYRGEVVLPVGVEVEDRSVVLVFAKVCGIGFFFFWGGLIFCFAGVG